MISNSLKNKKPQKLVLLSVAMLLSLAALDQTVISTALPTIIYDLGELNQMSWVVTSYLLSSTVVAPLYGKLGDMYGSKKWSTFRDQFSFLDLLCPDYPQIYGL